MEAILFILLALLIVYIYFKFISFVFDNFKHSSGLGRLFWFALMVMTFAYIFHSDQSQASNHHSYNNGGEDENDFWNNSEDQYDSCSWDSDTSSWDCYDD